LLRTRFGAREREAVAFGAATARLCRYESRIEALRLSHARGPVVAPPHVGQMA